MRSTAASLRGPTTLWSIIQTGLLEYWILDSTLTHVVSANPKITFEYIALLQINQVAQRWADNRKVNETSGRGIARVRIDEAYAQISELPNAYVSFLGLLRVASNWTASNQTRILRHSAFNPQDRSLSNRIMIGLVMRATAYISPQADYVLRLREDAGWYGHMRLAHTDKLTFKNCLSWKGLNDKLWFGPRSTVVTLHNSWLEEWERCHNVSSECSSEHALKHIVVRLALPYSQMAIPASDARVVRHELGDTSLCWKSLYACKRTLTMCGRRPKDKRTNISLLVRKSSSQSHTSRTRRLPLQ